MDLNRCDKTNKWNFTVYFIPTSDRIRMPKPRPKHTSKEKLITTIKKPSAIKTANFK